jgi:hypothetical protein
MGLRSSKPKHSKDKNSVKKPKKPGKRKTDVGFQAKKNKGKICQINESAQVTDESDTDNEDLTKIKTEDTEAPIFPKIPIMDSRPTEYDFDIDNWDEEECHQTSGYSEKWHDDIIINNKLCLRAIKQFRAHRKCYQEEIEKAESSPSYRCSIIIQSLKFLGLSVL